MIRICFVVIIFLAANLAHAGVTKKELAWHMASAVIAGSKCGYKQNMQSLAKMLEQSDATANLLSKGHQSEYQRAYDSMIKKFDNDQEGQNLCATLWSEYGTAGTKRANLISRD